MTVSAFCLNSLKEFECAFRDNSWNFEGLSEKLDNFFLVNGDIPTELEYIELLDAFATYFTSVCEDNIRMMIFHLIFPCGLNCSRIRNDFLIRLTQLSLCIGITPILELVSVRLKVQICAAIKSLETNQDSVCPLDDKLTTATILISKFVRGVVNAVLSIPGLNSACEAFLQSSDFPEALIQDHPLLNVLRLSPLFVSSLISGISLIYVASLVQEKKECSSPPPPLLLHVLLVWLNTTRFKNARTDWSSVDWEFILSNLPLCVLETFSQTLRCSVHTLPLQVVDSWTAARGLVYWTVLVGEQFNASRDTIVSNLDNASAVDTLFSELHYELLKNFTLPLPRGKFSRASSTQPDRSLFTWRLKYPEDLVPIVEYLRSRSDSSTVKSPSGEAFEEMESLNLSVLRLIEIVKLSWSSDRLLNCDPGDIIKLLKPFNSSKFVQLSCQALRR